MGTGAGMFISLATTMYGAKLQKDAYEMFYEMAGVDRAFELMMEF